MDVVASPPTASPSRRTKRRGIGKTSGFLILGGAVAGFLVLNSYLLGKLSKSKSNAAHLVPLLSTVLGVATASLGEPLFGPPRSKFTQWAFGLSRQDESFEADVPTDLEKLWWRSQESYSMNANMARNVVSHFLTSIQPNITSAYQAMQGVGEAGYAASRVAEAALRMRTLFAEVFPDEQVVAVAVRAGLSDHLSESERVALRSEVWRRLETMDARFDDSFVQLYYTRLLQSWLPG